MPAETSHEVYGETGSAGNGPTTTTSPPVPGSQTHEQLYDLLEQRHPSYTEQCDRWKRYRAFTEGIETESEKKLWLKQGEYESDRAYKQRLWLTELLGFAKPAVRRMVGGLTDNKTTRQHEGNLKAQLDEFDKRANRRGQSLDEVLKKTCGEGLKMGVDYLLIDRDRVEGAASRGAELSRMPFAEHWKCEEITNWDSDKAGVPIWVVLRREVSEQAGPLARRETYIVWKWIDRTMGHEYRAKKPNPGEKPQAIEDRGEWKHNLGMVPLAPFYAHECETFVAESYVEDLTRADKRKLNFDSDQSMASYLSGSPQLLMKVNGDLADVAADQSRILKVKTEEDASYLEINGAGMEVRETLIESTIRQGFNLAGIDPASVMQDDGPGAARSGVSLAWSFSTAEKPTLTLFTDELTKTDKLIHEIVARYLTPQSEAAIPYDKPVYEGEISRVKSWDMLAVDRSADLGDQVFDRIKSPEWRKAWAKFMARALPGGLPEETALKIDKEIDAADYEDVVEPPLPGMPGGGAPKPLPMPAKKKPAA